MKKHNLLLAALFVFGLIMAACARPPIQHMNMAHDAVIRAESDADAVNYASGLLVRARDTLTRMQNEADARRFEAATNFADEAISLAERAIVEGRAGAVRARDEAATLINNLTAPLAETTNALNAARHADHLNLDFGALSEDLYSARQNYDDARRSYANNNYIDAIAYGHNARSLLLEINADLNQAAQLALRK